jgi:hypothetical protein
MKENKHIDCLTKLQYQKFVKLLVGKVKNLQKNKNKHFYCNARKYITYISKF